MPHARLLPETVLPGTAGAVRAGDRVFLSGATAFREGEVAGLGDPAAQAEAALDRIEAALAAAGGSLADITRLTTCLVDRAHRKPVYEVIGRRLKGVYPVSTGLVTAGLARPEFLVQIDAEAVVGAPVQRLRRFELKDWFGQDIAWQGAMVAVTSKEIFLRGQTGSALDGSRTVGLGRRPEDAAEQADLALANMASLLAEAGAGMDEVCKITVHLGDRAWRSAVYPVIGRHFRGVHPVSTGLIIPGFARPEILVEIDAQVMRRGAAPHRRVRPYHSSAVRYGLQQQALDCDFCMAVRAGDHAVLRGQTGTDLDEVMHGLGNAAAQAEQAMENVAVLLGEAGASLADVVKATVFVTDRAFLDEVTGVVLRRLDGVLPAFSAIIVKGLASPELLMEVDITAQVGDGA